MNTDYNLFFGVLALQLDLIEAGRFAEACSAWAARKDTPLADLLVERGWLSDADRADVEKLLARKLKRHGGDAKAGLAEAADDRVRQYLATTADPEVRHTLTGPTSAPMGGVVIAATTYFPEGRDRYTLSRLHATGGIGRIWLARDAALGRDVALKELRPERAAQAAVWARFLKEAQITGQLEHPGIVPIYEVSRRPADQAPYYTMRFVRGLTLSEATAAYRAKRSRGEAGPLALRELLSAFVAVCNAVAYAHSRGVIHRDLKPQNVVLGDYGEVIVLDWGLAKLVDLTDAGAGPAPLQVAAEADGQATVQGEVLGTPAYMAPEQAEGQLGQIGPATDVYGLGAILYQILTGMPPFTGTETTAVLHQVVHEPPPRPRALDAAAPAALEAVCLKALAKKAADRYATAQDLANDMRRWLAGEPPSAYREPWLTRAGRWVKRHRVLVTGAAAAGLAALVGLAVILVLQARANQELAAANERERTQFDLAMDAVKTFHAGIGEDDLLKQPEFEGLRAKVLRQAADFYGKLESQLRGRGDRRSRTALGQAYYDLGELTAAIGSKEEGLAVHQRGLEVRQALAEEGGASPESKGDLAASLLAIGDVLAQLDRPDDALASDERARDILQPLAAAHPEVARFQSDLGKSHFQIGEVLWAKDRLPDALAAFERARDVQEPLAEANADVGDYQNDLAVSYARIGTAQSLMGKLDDAMASYDRAHEIQEKLAAANPSVARYQVRLAVTCRYQGGLLESRGRRTEAAACYERSRAIREALVKAHPAVTEYRKRLAYSCMEMSRQLDLSGKPTEALGAIEQGRDLFLALAKADPSVPEYPKGAADCDLIAADFLVESGKPEEALATLKRAQQVFQTLADSHGGGSYYRDELAAAASDLGELLLDMGRPEEASIALGQAREVAQTLMDAHPGVPDNASALAGVEIDRGRLLLQEGKLDAALACFQRARDLCQPLVDAHPAIPTYENPLASSLAYIGDVFLATHRPSDARAKYEQAAGIYEEEVRSHRGDPEAPSGVAFTLQRLGAMRQSDGHAAEAAAMYRRAFALYQQTPPHTPRQIYGQACCEALLSGVAGAPGSAVTADEGRAAAGIAMELLKKAIALGYRNLDAIRIEPGLDPLRQREDYNALLEDLKAKNKPNAQQ
jgi:serine/threonine-protein kinase